MFTPRRFLELSSVAAVSTAFMSRALALRDGPAASIATLPAGLRRRTHSADSSTGTPQPAKLSLIPYDAWANREPSLMQVWIPLA